MDGAVVSIDDAMALVIRVERTSDDFPAHHKRWQTDMEVRDLGVPLIALRAAFRAEFRTGFSTDFQAAGLLTTAILRACLRTRNGLAPAHFRTVFAARN